MEKHEGSYDVYRGPGGGVVKAWTRGVPFEEGARSQVFNAAQLPFIHRWVAVMPDVHMGIGATVGSVIPTVSAVIPAAVGVDIGCGMMAVKTSLRAVDLPENLHELRLSIESLIPHGRTNHGGRGDRGAWTNPPEDVVSIWNAELKEGYEHILDRHPKVKDANHVTHLGSLGTGNHFIEVCLDESDMVWFMLHSGSRGIGNRIGRYFIELAKEDMRRYIVNLPDADLAYFPEGTEHFSDYINAVEWAQEFAMWNRRIMMDRVVKASASVKGIPPFRLEMEAVNCHHNYVAREHHFGKNVLVTRKGAVRARKGDMGIIPGSMGAKSYIVRGKGNPESFHSCSHGAGRVMSRNAAVKRFTLEDHIRATAGVECRKDEGVIDETPGAYKDIDLVMEAQKDLVEIAHTLRQIVCVKG